MQSIHQYEKLEAILRQGPTLIYVHVSSCGICQADQPLVDKLAQSLDFPAFEINPDELRC